MSGAARYDLWLDELVRSSGTCAALRGTLTPKLLSGELSIAGASASVKASA